MTRQTDDMAAQSLLSRLGRGQDHARTKAALADELGWTERAVKQAVRDLRLGGWLVLAGNEGYWLDGSPEAWLQRQRSQIIKMRQTYAAVRDNWRKSQRTTPPELKQETLFGDAA